MVFEELKENFPYKVVIHERAEADDCIAALVENTQEFGQNEPVLIISADKDFAQLQKYGNVAQYSPVQRKWIKENTPRKQLMELVMRGDQADGVPNVLSADNVFTDGIRQTPLRQKQLDLLIDDPKSLGEDIYRNYCRNRKLIDLEEAPEDIKREIINNFISQDRESNKSKVFNYLVEKRCRRLLEDVRDFI